MKCVLHISFGISAPVQSKSELEKLQGFFDHAYIWSWYELDRYETLSVFGSVSFKTVLYEKKFCTIVWYK